ncbi:hypothetical protein HY251_00585 [bacterium]|nr:hypothetical protein [bacterium]
MSADPDDVLTSALEPDEKIVWADRPHGFFGYLGAASGSRHPRGLFWSGFGCLSLVLLLSALFSAKVMDDVGLVGGTGSRSGLDLDIAVLVIAGAFLGVPAAAWILTCVHGIVSAQRTRYAVTDRGRGLVVSGEEVASFEISADLVTATASGKLEHGDLDLGALVVTHRSARRESDEAPEPCRERVIFHAVSYPLIAKESVRSAAKARENAPPPVLRLNQGKDIG